MATAITPAVPGLGTSVTPATADATGNYVVVGSIKRLVLRFINGGGASINVTFDDPNTATPEGYTGFNPDVVVAVPNGTTPKYVTLTGARLRRFLNTTDGRVSWTYSSATSVSVEAISVV